MIYKNFEIKTICKLDSENHSYWTTYLPKLDGVVGGGLTEDEAISECKENLDVYLDWLKESKLDVK